MEPHKSEACCHFRWRAMWKPVRISIFDLFFFLLVSELVKVPTDKAGLCVRWSRRQVEAPCCTLLTSVMRCDSVKPGVVTALSWRYWGAFIVILWRYREAFLVLLKRFRGVFVALSLRSLGAFTALSLHFFGAVMALLWRAPELQSPADKRQISSQNLFQNSFCHFTVLGDLWQWHSGPWARLHAPLSTIHWKSTSNQEWNARRSQILLAFDDAEIWEDKEGLQEQEPVPALVQMGRRAMAKGEFYDQFAI